MVSNIFRGTLVGLGWGGDVIGGGITEKVFFDCSNCNQVGKVTLIALDGIYLDSTATLGEVSAQINNVPFLISESTAIGDRMISSASVFFKCHLLEIDFQCNGTDSVDFIIPTHDWRKTAIGYFLIIECIDESAPLVGYSILLNSSDSDPNISLASSNPVPLNALDFTQDIGFSIVGNVMNFMNGDASNVTFNGNYLGAIAGQDASSVNYMSSGVRGHFQYGNGVLEGLDDDSPDIFMDSTDALANVQSFMNSSSSFYFSCVHELPDSDPTHFTNPVLAGILVYTPLCDTFSVSVPSDTSVCHGTQLQLNVTGGEAYEWYPSTNLSCSDCPNPIFTADTSVFYTVKIWNNDSCFVSRPVKINVLPEIVFDSIVVSPSECGTSTGSVATFAEDGFSFTHVGGATMNNIGNFQNLSSGFHTFYAQNALGCQSADTTIFVPEINSSNVNFTANPLSGVSPLEVNFTNTSNDASVFEWFVNSESFGANLPSLILEQEGNYIVQLVGWQTNQTCADTATATIYVYDSLIIQLPNVFTPNDDGVNDTFTVQINQDVELEYTILNRWGNEIIVKSLSLLANTSTVLWDGSASTISDSPDGVYFIQLKIMNKNGDRTELNEFITLER